MTSISNGTKMASNAAIDASSSQISAANEKVYAQSNLLGDWTGAFTNSKSPIEFKVLSIKGSTAQVEYKHGNTVDRGTAQITKNQITFQDVTIATRDGQKGVILFQSGSYQISGSLQKTADATATAASQNKLVGSWSGLTSSGTAASFTVKSISGNTAQVTTVVNGITQSGAANYNAANNMISIGNTQITSTDGQTGNVIFKSLANTYSVPVKKASTTTSTTSTFA